MDTFGKYEVVEKIGVGGFGEVYKGLDPFIKRPVAIKTCTSQDESTQKRFCREAEIAGNLHHRHITTVYDFGYEDGTPYLVQEFLTGEDLDDIIERGSQIPIAHKIRWLRDAARGLRYAEEKGVVHRDIKPANVRVLADGTAKIMDFGIAKLLNQESDLTKTGMTIGTAAYLAPEQVKGESVDHRTDIFAFGVVAYELLTSTRPFAGQTFSAVLYQILTEEPRPVPEACKGCPEELATLVSRCMAKEPDDRYPGFQEIVDHLEIMARAYPAGPLDLDATPTGRVPSDRDQMTADMPAVRVDEAPAPEPVAAPPAATVEERAPTVIRPETGTAETAARTTGGGRGRFWAIAAIVVALAGGVAWWTLGRAKTADGGGVESAAPAREPVSESADAGATAGGAESADSGGEVEGDGEGAATAPDNDAAPTADEPAPPPPGATLVVAASWSPQITATVDGGSARPLNRERSWELEPGRHRVTFELQTLDYSARREVEIEVAAGDTRRLESPIQPPGRLTVQAFVRSPQGSVRLDGAELGATPLRDRAVEPGEHTLEIRPLAEAALEPIERQVSIVSGGAAIVTFDLTGERETVVLERGGGEE